VPRGRRIPTERSDSMLGGSLGAWMAYNSLSMMDFPRPLRRAPVVLLAVLASQLLAQSGPEHRAPAPIFAPRPETPVEAAGTGLAPEVDVRVKVGADGRVTEVTILSIEPSTDLDEIIERTTRETLLLWRFAPALSEGRPIATDLQWVVKFPTRSEQQEVLGQQEVLSWKISAEDDRVRYRKHILSMQSDERLELLEGFAGLAEGHLSAKNKRRFDSPRFIVFTDAPGEEVGQVVAGNLEATFFVLNEILKSKIDPQPEPYKIIAFMYASVDSFNGLKNDVRAHEWSAGFYNPAGLLAFHMNMPSNESLLGTMLHEATHAFIDRYVSRPGVVFPRWLGEGFAEYIGNSSIRKKQLIPGKTRRVQLYRSPWAIEMGRSQILFTIQEVRAAMRKGEALTLREIVEADRERFYGERRRMFYAMSWLLVHFLRHGEEGWADDEFPSLVLYVAEGYPAVDAFTEIYGEPGALEDRFRKYVSTF